MCVCVCVCVCVGQGGALWTIVSRLARTCRDTSAEKRAPIELNLSMTLFFRAGYHSVWQVDCSSEWLGHHLKEPLQWWVMVDAVFALLLAICPAKSPPFELALPGTSYRTGSLLFAFLSPPLSLQSHPRCTSMLLVFIAWFFF